ncbi:MAG: OmpA family protein [Proteobacteria bacterium]|nr:OmpA family protein [Pseudomonadota bacterium]
MAITKNNTGNDTVRNVGTAITVSLFMIILTFFILLNSMATLNQKKKYTAINSLGKSFGRSDDNSFSSPAIIDQKKHLENIMSGLDKKINKNIGIKGKTGIEILTIGEKSLFYTNKHVLKPESIALLIKLGNFINQGDYPVLIIGYTDNCDAQEKGYSSNWELSTLMAVQLQKYFIEECKIKPYRITAYGNGSQRPKDSNDTSESRQKNRRVEIIFQGALPVKKVYSETPSGNFTYKRFNFNVY